MNITLELTPDEETRLKRKAEAAGTTPETYLRSLLAADETPGMTGAEAIEYWHPEGALDAIDSEVDSPELARELRRQAETRSW